MKLHRPLIAAIIAGLRQIFVEGQYADRVVELQFKEHRKWGARDRKLFARSVFELVRWWRWFWYLAGLPDADHARPEAITEARLWQVWTAYHVAGGDPAPEFAECAGFDIAGVATRRVADPGPAVRAAMPDWLYELGASEVGPAWPALLTALNRPAEVFLRVNLLRGTTAQLQQRLHNEGVETATVADLQGALRLVERRPVTSTPSFRDGLFEVQDAASQRIAPFLEVEPGMRVIDACAGAGGKTLHLAGLMRNKGRIIALDVHEERLTELKRRARRHAIDIVETRRIESTKTIKRLAASADRVLLDVPCSGLGILRRNPDTKWKFTPEQLAKLRALQAQLLADYSAMVRPGGKLVYATCSILPSENHVQVAAFLARVGAAWKLDAELTLDPTRGDYDGFYAARLTRSAAAAAPVPLG
jgi:16S rRNA (cytosine967-C5)-methyltransferase